jgi:glutathione peroxidase-family protein
VFSLNQLAQAKGYIVVFTCNHCPFSQAYEQRIIDLDKKYAPLGYPVVAINPNDPSS